MAKDYNDRLVNFDNNILLEPSVKALYEQIYNIFLKEENANKFVRIIIEFVLHQKFKELLALLQYTNAYNNKLAIENVINNKQQMALPLEFVYNTMLNDMINTILSIYHANSDLQGVGLKNKIYAELNKPELENRHIWDLFINHLTKSGFNPDEIKTVQNNLDNFILSLYQDRSSDHIPMFKDLYYQNQDNFFTLTKYANMCVVFKQVVDDLKIADDKALYEVLYEEMFRLIRMNAFIILDDKANLKKYLQSIAKNKPVTLNTFIPKAHKNKTFEN